MKDTSALERQLVQRNLPIWKEKLWNGLINLKF